METSKGKMCPMHYSATMLACLLRKFPTSGYDAIINTLKNAAECTEAECAWWCGFAKDCAVPLLAGMFAESDACNTKFGGDK